MRAPRERRVFYAEQIRHDHVVVTLWAGHENVRAPRERRVFCAEQIRHDHMVVTLWTGEKNMQERSWTHRPVFTLSSQQGSSG